MVCSNTDLASTSPSVRVMVTHTSVPAVFRLWLATEPCRYRVSLSNPYTVGTTIGHPPVITPRWATSPASSTAYSDSRSVLPSARSLRCRVRSVADNGRPPPAGPPEGTAGAWFAVMSSPRHVDVMQALPRLRCQRARRVAMWSNSADQFARVRSYCIAVRQPCCWKSISVLPSPSSLRTIVTRSALSAPGRARMVKASRSGSLISTYLPSQRVSARSGPQARVVAVHAPPGTRSSETEASGTSTPDPPNQSAKRSGSVHSFHTSSRGAPNTRLIAMPPSAVRSSASWSATFASLLRAEPRIEAVEARIPEAAVLDEPVVDLPERGTIEP